jgi:hypothetical protein
MTRVVSWFVLALAGVGAVSAADLSVRATEVVAPCVRAAAGAYQTSSGQAVSVEAGAVRHASGADVMVGADVEMTRALEGGDAVIGTEKPLSRIPWVIASAGLNITAVSHIARGAQVTIFGGPAAYEARRALSARSVQLRETTDLAVLRKASVAVAPLSIAGPGDHTLADIPRIPVSAAVAEGARHPEAAAAFVSFLASPAGQAAFATCSVQ